MLPRRTMHWNYLGHAMWLAQVAGLRLLFDPQLEATHHGGVFEVVPRRDVDAPALRPDFIVVSHAHPDHFDVPSLRRLARLDPDTVLITSDPLIEYAAKRLGFRTVHRANAEEVLSLDGARLATTRSYGTAVEWGIVLETQEVSVWNQVDSWHRTVDDVATTLAALRSGLWAGADRAMDLCLARWQPLLEVAALLGERTRFPHRDYGQVLAQIAAVGAKAVVPASAGGRHVDGYDWMNAHTHPVPMERFLRDIAACCPRARALDAVVGGSYNVTPEGTALDRTGASRFVRLASESPTSPSESYRPVEVPPVTDVNKLGRDEAHSRGVVRRWVNESLVKSLAESFSQMKHEGALSFVLEVVYERAHEAYTLTVDSHGATVSERFDQHWDALDVIAGSLLAAVIEGQMCWGDLLLSGSLRAFERAYTVSHVEHRRSNVGATFVYYALPYDESFRRSVEWSLDHP